MHLIFCIFLILILIILLLSYFLIRLKFKYKDRIKIDEIYNDLPCVIAIKSVNKNFEYVYANSKFCKLINLSLNEIIGKTDFNLYHKDLAKKYRSLDIEALSDIYNANNFEKAIFEEGEYWNTIRSKFVSSTGEVYITTISVDITNIQKEYLKLEYAKRKIEESDEFLNNATGL